MRPVFRYASAAGVMCMLLCGCAAEFRKTELDSTRLVAKSPRQVACAYRQSDVVDARQPAAHVGGLSRNAFLLEDAAGLLRERMAAVGITADGKGQPVDVQLLHMYLAQNHVTKIPVVVLSAKAGERPAFNVRAQQPTMNWNGTENEAYRAYAAVLDDVMSQLVTRLDANCTGK